MNLIHLDRSMESELVETMIHLHLYVLETINSNSILDIDDDFTFSNGLWPFHSFNVTSRTFGISISY